MGFHNLTVSLQLFHDEYACDNGDNENDDGGDGYGDVDHIRSYGNWGIRRAGASATALRKGSHEVRTEVETVSTVNPR